MLRAGPRGITVGDLSACRLIRRAAVFEDVCVYTQEGGWSVVFRCCLSSLGSQLTLTSQVRKCSLLLLLGKFQEDEC